MTGAKQLKEEEKEEEKERKNNKRVLLKPGRSDLPMEKRSKCISCTNKIQRWKQIGKRKKERKKE